MKFNIQQMQSRKRILEQLAIQEIPQAASYVGVNDPAPLASTNQYFTDENGKKYVLSNGADFGFNNLLDNIMEENLDADTAKKKVTEFLSPFEQSKKDS